jgi:hypothetical protein
MVENAADLFPFTRLIFAFTDYQFDTVENNGVRCLPWITEHRLLMKTGYS